MKSLKLAIATSAAVLAITAGCAVSPPDNTYAFTPGTGTVDNVREARVAIPGGKAPTTWLKETTKPRWMQGYQLTLRMDDGTSQMITQDSAEFHAGDRVQITQEGRVLKAQSAAAASAAGAT